MWFKVDDKFHSAEEVKSIPRGIRVAAIGLWTLAGAWSSDHLKDGYVPAYMIDDLGGSEELAEALVACKLWRKVKTGYQFRGWEKWQITRETVEATRKAERDRKAAYRDGKRVKSGEDPTDVPPGQKQFPGTPSRPDPTIEDNYSSKRTSPRREAGSEEISTHGENPVDNYATAVQAVADRLTAELGSEFSLLEAGVVVDWILARAKTEVKMPRRYVRAALTRDWALWARYAHDGKFPE